MCCAVEIARITSWRYEKVCATRKKLHRHFRRRFLRLDWLKRTLPPSSTGSERIGCADPLTHLNDEYSLLTAPRRWG